ncbi:MAG TPA: DUF4397 domain-containing protein [Terriglobales bacterium]|nr:DUF4397 domain-containing protein [Terriglobales bacterium]
MKKILLASILSVLAIFAAGCGDEGKSQLRVVHASPDAPNVDVAVDGKVVLNNVPYGTASDYLAVKSGSRRITVAPTGSTTNVIDVKTDLANKKHYTVLAAGLVADIAPLQLTDDTTAPGSGKIRLRVVHGAPSAGSVDVYVTAPGADISTATPTLSNVAFKAISDYQEVPAGSYEIRVTLTGTKTVAIDSGTVALTAGQVRTVVALDAVGGGGPFTALVLADLN